MTEMAERSVVAGVPVLARTRGTRHRPAPTRALDAAYAIADSMRPGWQPTTLAIRDLLVFLGGKLTVEQRGSSPLRQNGHPTPNLGTLTSA